MKIAVIIPLYRQAEYVSEAVMSVLHQTFHSIGIVIVNDGCIDPASHRIGTEFAAAYPNRILYLKQENRGLSGARNSGIRRAMRHWPDIEAIFPLDADDMIQPDALEHMYARLCAAPQLDWVYPAIEHFGSDESRWCPSAPTNFYHILWDNQCCASSLIRREIFEAGVFYDETMRHGYEDWEFYLRAHRRGGYGDCVSDARLKYRKKPSSMLTAATDSHALTVATLQERHNDLFRPRSLTAIEHANAPRFLWVSPEPKIEQVFTDPYNTEDRARANCNYWPPIFIITTNSVWSLLKERGLLRGILLSAQAGIAKQFIAFTIENGSSDLAIRLSEAQAAPHLICFNSFKFYLDAACAPNGPDLRWAAAIDVPWFLEHGDRYSVYLPNEWIGEENLPALKVQDISRALCLLAENGAFTNIEYPQCPGEWDRQGSTRWLAWERHCVQMHTTYPLASNNQFDICLALPQLGESRFYRGIVRLLGILRFLVPNIRLHLLVTEGIARLGPDALKAFDNLIYLSHIERRRQAGFCQIVIRSMDFVVWPNLTGGLSRFFPGFERTVTPPDAQSVHFDAKGEF